MIRDQMPDIFLIQEMKMKKERLGNIIFSSTMNGIASNSEGASGGLLLLFNKRHFKIEPKYDEGNILFCRVFHLHTNDCQFLLNFYAPNNKRERKTYQTKVGKLVHASDLKKGIILVDFNTPLVGEEKIGGLAPDWDSKQDLSNLINDLAFLDLDLLRGLYTWSNKRIGHDCIQVRLDRALISLDWLHSFSCKLSLLPRVGLVHNIINKEEKFWRQRSRINWLKDGDRNTKFFHLSTLKHRANNRIFGIKKGQVLLSDDFDISDEAVSFFSSLLSGDPLLPKVDQEDLLSCIPQIIQPCHNKLIFSIPNDQEVREVIFSLPADKSPGPNGFPTFSFQMYWQVVMGDVVKVVQDFFGARSILKEINSTFLVLIPKTPRVDSLDKFRPISLCNSFYKIISKVLTSRFLKILPLIISQQQTSFVCGRQILDSILMVHEFIHSLEATKHKGILLKLDLSKAYDRVDWTFLGLVLQAFGFDHKVCKIISQLVSTPSLAVLINGAPLDFFKPTRGLRQGDPLLPILFIILAECIGRLIERKKKYGSLKGIFPSSKCAPFSHQQFVDDTIMGREVSIKEAKAMKEILDIYSRGTGQLINWDKSSIFFC